MLELNRKYYNASNIHEFYAVKEAEGKFSINVVFNVNHKGTKVRVHSMFSDEKQARKRISEIAKSLTGEHFDPKNVVIHGITQPKGTEKVSGTPFAWK